MKTRFIYHLLAALIVLVLPGGRAAETPSPEPVFEWAKRIPQTVQNYGDGTVAVLSDRSGELFLTSDLYSGRFRVRKLNREGRELWSRDIAGGSIMYTRKSTGPDGFCYITGAVAPNVRTNSLVTPEGEGTAFVLRMSPSGDASWMRRFGKSSQSLACREVVVDSSGNYYVAGSYRGTAEIGTRSLPRTEVEANNIFLAKFNAAGDVQWVRHNTDSTGYADVLIALDSKGNVLIAGNADGQLDPDFEPLNRPVGFVAKYDPDGKLQWVQRGTLNENAFTAVQSLAVDPVGNAYVVGMFFAGQGFLSVTKISTSGQLLWTKENGSSWNANLFKAAVDADGNCIVAGSYYDAMFFDNFTVTTIGNYDLFVVKYNPEGEIRWATTTTATRGVENGMVSVCFVVAGNIIVSPDGAIYIAAASMGPVKYGSNLVAAPTSAFNIAVARLIDPENPPIPALKIHRAAEQLVLSWPVAPSGFSLETSSLIGPGATWSAFPEAPQVVAEENVISTNPANRVKFFRLKKL